jgi:hypothetical protein
MRGPLQAREYSVDKYKLTVSYPVFLNFGIGPIQLPVGLSTQFVVSWQDKNKKSEAKLSSKSFERYLVGYEVLEVINRLLLAFKLVCVGHSEGLKVRTVGIGDILYSFVRVDEGESRDLRVSLNMGGGIDPRNTTDLAINEITNETRNLDRRYLRCYDLLEQSMYTEAFLIAFSALDDLVQQMLHSILLSKGVIQDNKRNKIIRAVRDDRLKIFLGPLLKAISGIDLTEVWPDGERALDWINKRRNDIAHSGYIADYSTAAQGIFSNCSPRPTAATADIGLVR